MIFMLKESPVFEILAICENEGEQFGYRDEGDRVEIRLKEKISRLKFEYIPKEIHPDIVALICYCAFYPFIKEWVTFPLEISLQAKSIFERFYLQTKTNGKVGLAAPIKVRNASATVTPYKSRKSSALISFGGGMDSTAVSLLYPEIPLVNQYDGFEQSVAMHELYGKIRSVNPAITCYSHYSNIRTLTKPEGFTGWTCCYLCALLMLVDCGADNILTGGVLGSKYLGGSSNRFIKASAMVENGGMLQSNKYFRNWEAFFLGLGVRPQHPVSGMSGVLTAKIVEEMKLGDAVLYCQKEEGRPCHSCAKCFTKNLALEYWEYQKTGEFRAKDYWEQYNSNDQSAYYNYLFRTTGHITNLGQNV